jgi:hypothetical protein
MGCDNCTCEETAAVRNWPVAETVRKLSLKPGDVLHVALGGDIGDGMPHWVPTEGELVYCYDEWQAAVPDFVTVIVTHHLQVPEILADASE